MLLQNGPIPAELIDHLQKAVGHIDSAERRLWKETERGLWAGRQAMARAAEAWLRFQGRLDGLLPPARPLPPERLQELLHALGRAAAGTPLEPYLTAIHAAEAAILAEPFCRLPNPPGDELRAGLARKYRYLDALRGLVEAVEEAIAERHVSLRVGDWVRLPRDGIGQLLDRQGLSGRFFVPSIGLTAPVEAVKGYHLAHLQLEPLALGADRPVGPPAYYWLLAANERWQDVSRKAAGNWVEGLDLHRSLDTLLDAAAKAWLIEIVPFPRQAAWSQVYAQPHVPLLATVAPPTIAEPLIEALRRSEALLLGANKVRSRARPSWQEELSDILRLTRSGLSAIEEALQPAVDLAAGEWVEVLGEGRGRIAQRDGQRLVVDLGCLGVLVARLFETPLQRVASPVEPSAPPEVEHRCWLWYACHPQACRGRDLCPCCRLPGIAAGELSVAACLLCGWTHDGDDYDPARRNLYSSDLNLDLGRRRFKELGYAHEPLDAPPGWVATWLEPQVLARRQRLVTALHDLALSGSEDPDQLEALDGLWADYLAGLAPRPEQ